MRHVAGDMRSDGPANHEGDDVGIAADPREGDRQS